MKMRIFNQGRKHIVFVIIAVTLGYFIFSCGGREKKDQMEMIGSIKPRNSLEISQSYWGIQAGTLDEKIIESAKDIGVKWTRLEASWSSIERGKDESDWG